MTAPELGSSVSWLFVPGDRPDRFDKAAGAGADEVIIDLEDAVAPERKTEARTAAAQWLAVGNTAWVRINAANTEYAAADLAELTSIAPKSTTPGLRGLVVPRATPAAIYHVASRIGVPLIALIESAEGICFAAAVAQHPRVVALAFGSIDFALDIGAEESDETLLFARSTLVIAARAAGLPGPIDGVCVDVRDPAAAQAQARRSRALGFGGKLCIHPAQVPAVAAAYRPDPDAVEDAERLETALRELGIDLMTADPAMALAVEGRMVDGPVLRRAQLVLARVRAGATQS